MNMTSARIGRVGERGEGKLGLLVALLLVGSAIFVGIKVVPVRVAAYEFRDVLRQEARYGAVRADNATVVSRILEKAEELEIPLRREDLEVRRSQSEIFITCRYEQPIDLKLTTYVYRFDAREKAPLF